MATIIAFAFDSIELEKLEISLKPDNYTLLSVNDVNELVSAFEHHRIDALLIGGLADENLVKAVRVIISSTLSLQSLPILMVGTYQSAEDIARILNLGVDDYIPQSAGMSVVSAHLRSHLRRIQMHEQAPEELAIVLDVSNHQLLLNGNPVHVTQSEFNILLYLARHSKNWHSSSEIFNQVWQKTAGMRDEVLVRNHIRNLRSRLAAYPEVTELIATRQGRGYTLSKSVKIQ